MKCVMCGNVPSEKLTEVTRIFGGKRVHIKNVPCLGCDNCGEIFIDYHIATKLTSLAEITVTEGKSIFTQYES